jgi:hypothetical protein
MIDIRFCTCGIAERAHPTEGCPGFEADAPALRAVPTVGSSPTTQLPKLVADVRRTSWIGPELLSATFDAPRFAVDGLIPEGLGLMCGAPKLGKSWLALGLAIAVAGGGRALGEIPVERGEALYLALEDSPRRLQSRLRMVLAGSDCPVGLHIETEWPRLDEGGLERLEGWLDDQPDARLILIDVWPRIRPRTHGRGDSNHYQADYDAGSMLQAMAINRGIAIVTLFHTRKAESDDFVEMIQGTLGTAGAADTLIVVKRARGQADATLHITGRDVEERELALQFVPAAGTWALMGDAAEWTIGHTRKELLDAITAHGTLTPKQAAEVTSVNHELAKKTMQRMFTDGQLEAIGGRYSVRTSVHDVPLSPGEALPDSLGDKGTGGTGDIERKACPECQAWPQQGGHFAGCSRRSV